MHTLTQQLLNKFSPKQLFRSVCFCSLIICILLYFITFSTVTPDNKEVFFYGKAFSLNEQNNSANTYTYLDNISLSKGSYDLTINYSTDTDINTISIICADYSYGTIKSADTITLYSNKSSITSSIWINNTKDLFQLNVAYGATGDLNIESISFEKTLDRPLHSYFIFCCVSLLLIIFSYFKLFNKTIQNRNIVFSLFVISFLSSIPLFTNYLFRHNDLYFHLLRIEGLKDGLLAGTFPVKIQPTWLNGYGYASSTMYGDLFLYFPALLRLMGFSLQGAYKIYVVAINIVTCLISYYCIKNITKDSCIGLIGSLLYMLSSYRFTDVYLRYAVGEYTAMVFLPLIVYGIYCILNTSSNKQARRLGIIFSVIGYSGVIQSHVLTCEMAGGFTLLACLLLWKQVFKKENLFALCQVVVFTILLNLWWLVPFFDYMLEGNLQASSSPCFIQARGTFIAQLLMPFSNAGNTAPWSAGYGIVNEIPLNIGLSLSFGILLFLYVIFMRKKISNKQYVKFSILTMGLGLLTLYMTTIHFPYDKLMDMNYILRKLLGTIQFPWRLLTIATILIVFSSCALLKIVKNNYSTNFTFTVFGIMIVCVLLPHSYSTYTALSNLQPVYIYDIGGLNTCSVIGGEYLHTDTDTSLLKENAFTAGENIQLNSCSKKYLTATVHVTNTGVSESYIEVPMLYYKGYIAKDTTTLENFSVSAGTNNVVRVSVPVNYTGTIIVTFESPWYWNLAEGISLLFIFVLLWICIKYTIFKKR